MQEYALWEITEDESIKLKLSTSAVCELENKLNCSLTKLIQNTQDILPLNIMLNIVQYGAKKYGKELKFKETQEMFDRYVDDGNGSQVSFFTDVIIPLFAVSGFFPKAEAEEILSGLEEAKAQLKQ